MLDQIQADKPKVRTIDLIELMYAVVMSNNFNSFIIFMHS